MENKIQITPEAQEILKDLKQPAWIAEAIAKAMAVQNQLTLAQISRQHLTGQGPFPVDEHKLGVRTGRLRGAASANAPEIRDQRVETSIGDSVEYAAIHEFGGRIHREARSGTVRLRTDSAGELLRQAGFSHLAVFAKPSHKRAKEVSYQAAAHDMEMPERAPFRTGIEERMPEYGEAISRAIVEAWGARG